MTPEEERRLQLAAATLTAHYYDPATRDKLLSRMQQPARVFSLLDQAAAHVGGPAAGQDPQEWLSGLSDAEPGLDRSVVVFSALAGVTGIPAAKWAATFAMAASPDEPPAQG
jgi:hypothetical protein